MIIAFCPCCTLPYIESGSGPWDSEVGRLSRDLKPHGTLLWLKGTHAGHRDFTTSSILETDLWNGRGCAGSLTLGLDIQHSSFRFVAWHPPITPARTNRRIDFQPCIQPGWFRPGMPPTRAARTFSSKTLRQRKSASSANPIQPARSSC